MSVFAIENYNPKLGLLDTEKGICLIKTFFQKELSSNLNLYRVSAPIFVDPQTGLNDNLSGHEEAVSFDLTDNSHLEIVQSLAKWKRNALKKYNLKGLYTDMNAIRKNEKLDNFHSVYVDQWDWEKTITKEDRNINFLKEIVNKIYLSIKNTETYICGIFPSLCRKLPENIFFITSEELLKLYPNLNAKQREYEITKKYKAVFIIGIGCLLSNNTIHDDRAADYDDWNLNGDILVWYDLLDRPLELSSMGIRVNSTSLKNQISFKKEEFKFSFQYHKDVLSDLLPLTIGGGIGQSRLCMFMLDKAHIGEVQSSYWSDADKAICLNKNIKLL